MVEWKLNVSTTCHGVLKIAPQVFVQGFFRSLLGLLCQKLQENQYYQWVMGTHSA
jgi:hypothetical protein